MKRILTLGLVFASMCSLANTFVSLEQIESIASVAPVENPNIKKIYCQADSQDIKHEEKFYSDCEPLMIGFILSVVPARLSLEGKVFPGSKLPVIIESDGPDNYYYSINTGKMKGLNTKFEGVNQKNGDITSGYLSYFVQQFLKGDDLKKCMNHVYKNVLKGQGEVTNQKVQNMHLQQLCIIDKFLSPVDKRSADELIRLVSLDENRNRTSPFLNSFDRVFQDPNIIRKLYSKFIHPKAFLVEKGVIVKSYNNAKGPELVLKREEILPAKAYFDKSKQPSALVGPKGSIND